MKKIISLQVIAAISLAIGSASLIEAYGNSNKYASKSEKNHAKFVNEDGSVTMHSIEHDLHEIKRNFKENDDIDAANARLDLIPTQIDLVVTEMKDSEEHGKMWEVHLHTLNRKLRKTREFVNRHASKKAESSKEAKREARRAEKEARKAEKERAESSNKKESKKDKRAESKKDKQVTMKSVEKELHKIKRDFKKNGDVYATNARLDRIPAEIDLVVADMKNHEKHGKMWEVHLHTLNRKLHEVRKFVFKHEFDKEQELDKQ